MSRCSTILAVLATVVGLASSPADATRFVLVSHAPDTDSWWNVIKQSVKDAGQDFGVTVDYWNPHTGDLKDMAKLLQRAGNEKVDGVITTIADFNLLAKPIQDLTLKQHIPVITINSGLQAQSVALGAIMHVGQPEYDAGHAAGERAHQAGIHRFVCLNHYATNPASRERCRGFAEAIGENTDETMLVLDGSEDKMRADIQAYLVKHPQVEAVLALGPTSMHPALDAIRKLQVKPKLVATFDVSDKIVAALKRGEIQFAIDQQPYLQGYIPVAVLAEWRQSGATGTDDALALERVRRQLKQQPALLARLNEYGLTPVYKARHIQSGPGFVTRDNVDKVERYAGQYR